MTLLVMESKYILIMMDVVLRLIYFGGSGMFVRMICVACTFLTDA